MKKIDGWQVRKAKCPTCPFRTDERGRHRDPHLVGRIQEQCLKKASQICHHPALYGKPQTYLCRGARDFQLEIFYRLGLLKEPSDAAWKRVYEKIKRKKTERSCPKNTSLKEKKMRRERS